MGKSREFFKKIKDIKRIFHERIGMIRAQRNGKDLTEAEKDKKRWQEYTGKPYEKVFMIQTTMICGHSPITGHPGV